jgi:sugar phosphate isomerase/epimerase
MRVGISTACFYPYINTEDTLEIIKELGFDLCEVFLEAVSETNEKFCYKLKNKAEKLGISIHSVHAFNATFEPFLFDRYERRRKEMEMRFTEVCKAGNIFGAKFYTFHGITSTMPNTNLDEIGDGMNRLCEIANNYNIGLSQENVSWCKSGDLEYLKELNRKIGKELRFTLDVKQAVRRNQSPIDYLEIYKDRLSTVHINDASLEATCLLPGHGNMNLKGIIDNVTKLNPDIPYIIEVYRENFVTYEQLKASKEYLLSI